VTLSFPPLISLNLKKVKNLLNLLKYFVSKSTENETCNQGKASTSTSTLTALLGETNTDDHYDVGEELGFQSDFTEVVDDTQTPQTPMINFSDRALWAKFCDRKMIDHLILHGPRKI
jgi:hypothetical protein